MDNLKHIRVGNRAFLGVVDESLTTVTEAVEIKSTVVGTREAAAYLKTQNLGKLTNLRVANSEVEVRDLDDNEQAVVIYTGDLFVAAKNQALATLENQIFDGILGNA